MEIGLTRPKRICNISRPDPDYDLDYYYRLHCALLAVCDPVFLSQHTPDPCRAGGKRAHLRRGLGKHIETDSNSVDDPGPAGGMDLDFPSKYQGAFHRGFACGSKDKAGFRSYL